MNHPIKWRILLIIININVIIIVMIFYSFNELSFKKQEWLYM